MATAAENWLLWLRGARVHRRNSVRDCRVCTAPNTEREQSDRRGALHEISGAIFRVGSACRNENRLTDPSVCAGAEV